MDRTKVKAIIQEAINRELKEIFGFGRKSTEKLTQTDTETIPQQESFSMEKLKNLRTSKEIRRYTQITLGDEELGRGQARVAYLVGNDKVLKVALSDNKAYQNQNEITNSKCLGSRYTPKIYDFDPRFSWILTEHVNQTKSTEVLVQKLNELTGLDQEEELRFGNSFDVQDFFSDLAALTARENVLPKYQNRHDFLMSHSEWYQGLVKSLIGCKVSTWDFHKNNWGIRPSTGELVLLDVGFNPAESDPEKEFFKESINFDELNQLKSRPEIVRYLVKKVKKLGSGTFRAVFPLSETKVIKIATMDEGIEHNQREFKNSRCIGSKHAVQILDHHPDFWWLIEERVDLLDDEQFIASFFQHLGVNQNDYPWFDDTDIMQAIELSQSGRTVSRYKDDFVFEKLFKASQLWLKASFWYRGLIANLKGCQVGSDDFGTNNWGIRPSTGELILIDLGF